MRISTNGRIIGSFVLALVVIALVAFAPSLNRAAQAQDAMAHVCDSTTIQLLFIAEYEYGYQPMMDISTFELGQYAPLFGMMMSMMEADDMSGEEMMDEEMMGEEMMDEGMSGEMMMLSPLSVPDEDPACTELRASVEGFIYKHFTDKLMMSEEMGS